jgi:hypothetical protein
MSFVYFTTRNGAYQAKVRSDFCRKTDLPLLRQVWGDWA